MNAAPPAAPLAGIKVIELARILAGPWAGQTLSDLGADVVKVEAPEGDDTRRWGPPFIDRDGDRSAAYFHATSHTTGKDICPGPTTTVSSLRCWLSATRRCTWIS